MVTVAVVFEMVTEGVCGALGVVAATIPADELDQTPQPVLL